MKNTRNTVAKTAILDIIKKSDVALSHIEIQKINENLCDRVTIYRILERLINEDAIHKIATPEGTIKYAACNHNHNVLPKTHNHVHFSCQKCGSVSCLDAVQPEFSLPEKYVVKEVNFTVSGLCPSCVSLDNE